MERAIFAFRFSSRSASRRRRPGRGGAGQPTPRRRPPAPGNAARRHRDRARHEGAGGAESARRTLRGRVTRDDVAELENGMIIDFSEMCTITITYLARASCAEQARLCARHPGSAWNRRRYIHAGGPKQVKRLTHQHVPVRERLLLCEPRAHGRTRARCHFLPSRQVSAIVVVGAPRPPWAEAAARARTCSKSCALRALCSPRTPHADGDSTGRCRPRSRA